MNKEQPTKEAAKETLSKDFQRAYIGYVTYDKEDMFEMFRKGAEWQAKQSQWIRTEDKLPDTDNGQSLCEVLAKTNNGRYSVIVNVCVEEMAKVVSVTHWCEIPQ